MEPLSRIIKAIGIVFGDIGTSPIYTLSIVFALIAPTRANIMGVLSLIIWTLILLVTVQYIWLAMSLSQKGEGGTIVLRKVLKPLLNTASAKSFVTILSFIGISFLIGDGVITPAISILSAVEGVKLIPGMFAVQQNLLVLLACLIAIGLFSFQKQGAEIVSGAFGPIMVLWFLILGGSGLYWLAHDPSFLSAFNPLHIPQFMYHNGFVGFLVLARVILCATGGEALYAGIGNLGRRPIINGWYFAFVMLLLHYLGQGVFIMNYPGSVGSIFYQMMFTQMPRLYIPFVLLSVIATVIASQAMISGIFATVYQGIMTNILPRLRVEYTSRRLSKQIYIPAINWSLMIMVLIVILQFKSAYHIANAYGLAALCTMTITSVMMTMIFYLRKEYVMAIIANIIVGIDITYLAASTSKVPYGGYLPIFIASIPLSLILIYTGGKRRLLRAARPRALPQFIEEYEQARKTTNCIDGTALFFSRRVKMIPDYISYTMFNNDIMYEENIILSVITQNKPFGVAAEFGEKLAEGLFLFEIRVGYMEALNIKKVIKNAKIDPKVIFYGMEEIESKNLIWKIFAFIKSITPSFVQFYKLPTDQLHGVVRRVEI